MKHLSKNYIKLCALLFTLAALMVTFGLSAFALQESCLHENTEMVSGKEGNCYEAGYTDGVFCLDCESFISGHLETAPVHSGVNFKRIEPTCTEVGYTEGVYCILCESFISGHEELPLAPHETEEREGTEPGCTTVGYTKGMFCTMCESWISGHEEIPAAHKEIIVFKEPETCIKDGYTEGTYCTVCQTYTSGREVIPASHKEVYVPEEPATCTGNGHTAGLYCTVCNEYLWGHVEIPFIDHSFTEKIIDERHLVRKATNESPALYRYDCATCTAISPTLTFTYGERIPIGATAILKAAQSTSAIKLAWSPVAGAVGYRIYYRNANTWKAVRDTTETTTTFTGLVAGTGYTFAVRAFCVDEGKQVFSHDYTTIQTATKPVAPAKIAAKQNTSAIKLAWSPVKNATGYRIYYRTSTKADWKVCVSSIVETSHTFTGLPAGKSYQFAVRPYLMVSGGLVWGEYSTYITSTIPATPKVTATSPAPRHISLTWTAVNADGYQVFYSVNGGKYKLYKTYTSPQKLMFSSLTSSSTFTFAVRAVKKTSGGYIYGGYTPVSTTVR